jgi:hypothetical protein
VAVAAGDGHRRLGQAELGTDDVDNALVLVVGRPQRDAGLAAVAFERRRHFLGHHVEKRASLRTGGHDVIDRAERAIRIRHPPSVLPQHVERLRRRDFVHQMQADEELRLADGQPTDGVRIPDFVKKCLSHEPDPA